MGPRIESIGTPFGEPLESIDVVDVLNFAETVRVLIGPSGEHGEEIFDVRVASPRWIEEQCVQSGYWLSRRTLVIAHWHVGLVRTAIEQAVLKVSGETWESIAQQLAAFMDWEFQDYKES